MMIKAALSAASMVVAIAAPVFALGLGSSGGEAEPVYYITYYADAAMTQPVGYVEEFCASWGVGSGPTIGQYGPYESRFLAGYCLNGNLVWLPDDGLE